MANKHHTYKCIGASREVEEPLLIKAVFAPEF